MTRSLAGSRLRAQAGHIGSLFHFFFFYLSLSRAERTTNWTEGKGILSRVVGNCLTSQPTGSRAAPANHADSQQVEVDNRATSRQDRSLLQEIEKSRAEMKFETRLA
jgi:hypothetical protein